MVKIYIDCSTSSD